MTRKMFKSKRFLAFVIALTLFIGMLLITEYSPMELAGSITMITGVYVGGESYRSSNLDI